MFGLSQVQPIEWLFAILFALAGLVCALASARRIVQSSAPSMSDGHSPFAGFLMWGGMACILAAISILYRDSFTSLLRLPRVSFLSWVLIIWVGVAGLACLVIIAWQMRASDPPVDNLARLRRSILIGFMISGLLGCMFVIAGLLDLSYQWSFMSLIVFSCTALPFQVMATVGAYIRFGLLTKIRRNLSNISDKYGQN